MKRVIGMLGLLLGLSATLPAQFELPDGDGKALTQKKCGSCHGFEGIVPARNTPERWGVIVDDMVSRGATGTDEQIEKVIAYLSKNFAAKANLNKSTAKELVEILGITPGEAAAIVSYREKTSPFKELADLKKVTEVDFKKIEAKKDRLIF